MKPLVFIILVGVFVPFFSSSCKNDPNLLDKDTITIDIYGDKHISLKEDSIEVKKSSKWRQIKKKVLSMVECDEPYVIKEVLLEEDGEYVRLVATYIFEKDVTIHITSRPKNNGADDGSSHIIVEIAGDRYVNIGENEIEVQKGAMWQDIKDDVSSHLSFETGYELSKWKLRSSRGQNLQNGYIFKKNTKVYAMSKRIENNDEPTPDEPVLSEPSEPLDENNIDDEKMIDVKPPDEGFVCPPIDYSLPQHPDMRRLELWEGVFKSGKRYHILPYRMAKYELTYRLWKDVYEWAVERGYTFSNEGSRSTKDDVPSDKLPIVGISWRDAVVWCNAYTQKLHNSTKECVYLDAITRLPLKNATDGASCDGALMDFSKHGMRLPKEEEWEYAARCQMQNTVNGVNVGTVYLTKLDSCSAALFPIATPKTGGKNYEAMYRELVSTTVCQQYFYGSIIMRVKPDVLSSKVVARKKANYLGFYDMSGNVAEFCTDQTKDNVFGIAGKKDNYCIVRGGAWNSVSYDCSVGRRFAERTTWVQTSLGFRLCQTK